ncbi:MAG: AtpZ/AtpI family protein [Phycisphaeraceae bacterium]|nr:AtpZ/AtpI family protein [Phycisphaeraceae bacterium]
MAHRPDPSSDPRRFLGSGLELVGILGFFLVIGYVVDGWLNSRPWCMIIGAIVGIVGGLYRLIRQTTEPRQR